MTPPRTSAPDRNTEPREPNSAVARHAHQGNSAVGPRDPSLDDAPGTGSTTSLADPLPPLAPQREAGAQAPSYAQHQGSAGYGAREQAPHWHSRPQQHQGGWRELRDRLGDQAEQAPYTLLGASALVGLFLSTRLGYQALKIVTRSGLHIGLATATRELADNFLSHVR